MPMRGLERERERRAQRIRQRKRERERERKREAQERGRVYPANQEGGDGKQLEESPWHTTVQEGRRAWWSEKYLSDKTNIFQVPETNVTERERDSSE